MKIVSLLTCISFFFYTAPALAIDLEHSFSNQTQGQAEYFNSNKDRRMTIQVNILSGVNRPGVHQFPDTTNLIDALSLAGGLTADADFEKVYLKRKVPGSKTKFETLKYDVTDLVSSDRDNYPLLQNYDTILVDARPKTDQKLLTVLTIVASTVGIISGVMLIRKLND